MRRFSKVAWRVIGTTVVGLLATGPLAASAVTAETPEGIYAGTEHYGIAFAGEAPEYSDFDSTYGVTCQSGTCTTLSTFSGAELPVVEGTQTTTEVAAVGDECASYVHSLEDTSAQEPGSPYYYAAPYTATVLLEGETLTVVESNPPSRSFTCPGSDVVFGSWQYISEFKGTLDVTATPTIPDQTPTDTSTAPDYWVPLTTPLAADTPSVLSGLPTVAEALTPMRVGMAASGAVVLTLLMAFPSRLLSGARDSVVERVKAWWMRRRVARALIAGRPAPVPKPVGEKKPFGGWLLAIVGLLIASVLAVFIDPRVGLDGGTLRLLGSVFIAFLAEVGLGWFVLIFVVRRTHPGTRAWFTFKPWLLLAVAAAVLFVRLTGLQPGIAFGAVAAVAFAAILNERDRARFTFVNLAYAFGLAVVAWVAYSLVTGAFGTSPQAWQLFLQESLAAATVAGISLLPLLLVPVRGLPGHEIYGWNRVVWAVSYVVGLTAFIVLLLPLPTSWKEVSISIWAWIGLFVLYALVAIALWLVLTRPWKPAPVASSETRS